MLIECRFCLEELEVRIPQQDCTDIDCLKQSINNPTATTTCGSTHQDHQHQHQQQQLGLSYTELRPLHQSKRKKKDIGCRLVRPCACKGTQQHVHVKCLCEWIAKCNKWYCTICQRVYNLSPSQLHYCVVKLQRKGALKNLPPIYSNSDFSRSSYFILLVFMGTLSMLMLPSTLPPHTLQSTSPPSSSASGYSSLMVSAASNTYYNPNPTTSSPMLGRQHPVLPPSIAEPNGSPYYNSQISLFFSSSCKVVHQSLSNSLLFNQRISSLLCKDSQQQHSPSIKGVSFTQGPIPSFFNRLTTGQQQHPSMSQQQHPGNCGNGSSRDVFGDIMETLCNILPVCATSRDHNNNCIQLDSRTAQ
ncbi:hypothetical protein SAMD00019534_070140 [Acytostelium subglobosum LB1]|uniref:hypothetical protein n=1 Tax=Acytostelium subglobosum LB1 TaxID=1410327 RepID=UPI000644B970|nr:hypothetical protein SAMD00019534_070140 [Acytostelium subglobosum LB1]GAM23839.1 hypothetical protein SAMD00019534_070140 [Acytostelium subglobosum LB1]|eukprot:XP_012752875.1 hypothetical protein SAMD00019534_070140 [Acytostelium subglobosum LB1]